ncbi:RNA-dependent RNA polymerase [Brassica campestris chinensis coguvirus 1]|uniref:RNA-directed RNA polymerase L n=1 Tax=Brassica campestris chinensis coguvirus 1 TaxID=2894929 RepID=A0A8K1Z7E4_9VIRU|nr:RNA-dependent RNA polymerase [Brassica campestris chinensis coguvirus 1]UFE16634.1 RNA-dependent RNA polymerase [Brassica campestris chinensis coguvirus 1]
MSQGALRPDSNFSIGNLELIPTETPEMFSCGQLPEPRYEIDYNGEMFTVTINGRKAHILSTDNELKKIRHEIVADVMCFNSDEPLSTIGVQGEEGMLSPDFINVNSRTVLELATTANSEPFSLKRAFNGKHVKYNYLIEPLGFKFMVLVVAPTCVYANIQLTQDIVNALCYRMRVGQAIESIISEYLGTDIFNEDSTLDESIVMDVFRGLQDLPDSVPDFDMSIINDIDDLICDGETDLFTSALKKTLSESTKLDMSSENDLQNYLKSFDSGSRTSKKRVCNLPQIFQLASRLKEKDLDPHNAKGMPMFLKKIWTESKKIIPSRLSREEQKSEAMGYKSFEKHRVQKKTAFNCNTLTREDKIEAAKTGLWAKALSTEESVIQKVDEDKKSFHPILTEVDDVKRFMNLNLLDSCGSTIVNENILKLLKDGKSLWNDKKVPLSLEVVEALSRTVAVNFGQTISNYMSEICYAHKYWIKRADFYHKEFNGVHMLIRCTGAHIFVSFAFNKSNSICFEQGRIGPEIFESENYYFTDVCSYSEPVIEHFVKAGPYICSIICHLLSHLEMHLADLNLTNKVLNEHLSAILLLFMNNKTDAEELITGQRYLTMGILEELDPNPWRFCERLPTVIRSRLTCYLIQKTIDHMRYYSTERVMKIPGSEVEDYDITYAGLKSMFGNYEPSLKQKVNEFYFGYVVSKEKGRGNDRNFKIMKKIVDEEYRFRDTVINTFSTSLEPKIHVSNPVVIKVFILLFKEILKTTMGKDYEKIIKREIVKNMAQTTFDDLATLKVSARDYEDALIIPNISETSTLREIITSYEKVNVNETKKRPRAMESLKTLLDEYIQNTGKKLKHPVELVPYCLKCIRERGFWDSDIFPKSQHGGDREIHVLEIKMRIIQYFVENISKTLCKLVPSDTLTHPYQKETFVKNHYREANAVLGDNYFTLGKSADATKWCQRNDSSKFAAVTAPFLPKLFRPFFLMVMRLWKEKRMSFPIAFAANFRANKTVKSNKTYERMRDEFNNGKGIFKQVHSNKMFIRSGMMQGILHYTSSFTHAVIQEVMKKVQLSYLKFRGVKAAITVVQGSDDSAELISFEGNATKNKVRLATTMLHWKEKMSKYFSIYTSRAKSSIGTLDLIEYNSEWYVRTNIVKPTFRWASACLHTTVTERFIDRIRINYNVSSQVLEGGGKIFEVAMLQLCQAWLHYMLIGMHTSDLSEEVCHELIKMKDPSLGYYPLDSDYIAGITGVEFQLYNLVSKSNYGVGLSFSNLHEPTTRVEEDEIHDQSVSLALRSIVVSFSDAKLWREQVRRMNVPDLEKLVEEVEQNPYLIYALHKSWEEAKYSIFLKMFQPGVKESISKHAAAARIMSASAYMISRPCVSMIILGERKKMSLLKAIYYQQVMNAGKRKAPIDNIFMHSNEYGEILDYIEELETNSSFINAKFKTRSKQKICVFEKAIDDIPIIDLCRKNWFGLGKLPLSKRQVRSFWEEAKLKYPFLDDDRKKTKEILNMNEVELKNFLESITSKPRHIVLLDTSAKSASLYNSITRVFWTGTKIVIKGVSDIEESSFALRSRIFSIVSSWYTHEIKLKKVCDMILRSSLLCKLKVPSRVLKLKVLHKWLTTRDKNAVSRYINSEKLGSVGFFTSRQTGWGENRKGVGEWRGRVLDIPVVIKMDGNECTKIGVQRLSDLRQLGSSLIDLVTSFCLVEPTEKLESEHWISMSGRITGGHGRCEGIPLFVVHDLDVSIVDKVIDYPWELNIANNRIRLVAKYTTNLKITLLSVPFSSRDWDPAFPIHGDDLLTPWSSGTPMPISLIESEIDSILPQNVGWRLVMHRKRFTHVTKSGWNLGEFISVLNKQTVKDYEIPTPHDPFDNPAITDDYYDDSAELDAFLDDMNCDIQTQLKVDFTTEFNDENDSDVDLFDLNPLMIERLEAQLALFDINITKEYNEYTNSTTMPKSNLCFFNLDRMSHLMFGASGFEDLVRNFIAIDTLKATGLLGKLLLFFTGRDCSQELDGSQNSELLLAESDAESLMRIMADENDLGSLSIERIESYIPLLDTAILSTEGIYRNRFVKSREKFMTAINILNRTRHDASCLLGLRTDKVILTLKPILLQYDLIDKNFRSLPDGVFIKVIKNQLECMVDEKFEEGFLSGGEQSGYREAIRKTWLTSGFIDVIAIKYLISISCGGYSGNGTRFYLLKEDYSLTQI